MTDGYTLKSHRIFITAIQPAGSDSDLPKVICHNSKCVYLSPRFEINFLCDRDDRIAFHFNPRFTESDIICNSFIANHWGKEERCSNFPFGIEEPFQVTDVHFFTDRVSHTVGLFFDGDR